MKRGWRPDGREGLLRILVEVENARTPVIGRKVKKGEIDKKEAFQSKPEGCGPERPGANATLMAARMKPFPFFAGI
ncbi:MAG TPA: hypothetical protein PLD09_06115 [Methanomassiliicoccaceae archaeon]|jgi:hypothetical protein|nr:hypothetical protein [Methanomassiliicoccaceae archaeon]HPP44343.1 hypothetical protein [Methanomassiliicoccaceae archaeon]HQA21430.1 hypothetical protein [Methanomassiliicoccaceae archaeon]